MSSTSLCTGSPGSSESGRHNLRATSLAKLQYDLAPLRDRHGDLPVERLTKTHLDCLVVDLPAGRTKTARGRTRKPWAALSVNKVISTVAQVLADSQNQGVVNRNVGELVSLVSVHYKEVDTYTQKEVDSLLAFVADNRIGPRIGVGVVRSAPWRGRRFAVDRCGSGEPIPVSCQQPCRCRGQGRGERSQVGYVTPDASHAGSLGKRP